MSRAHRDHDRFRSGSTMRLQPGATDAPFLGIPFLLNYAASAGGTDAPFLGTDDPPDAYNGGTARALSSAGARTLFSFRHGRHALRLPFNGGRVAPTRQPPRRRCSVLGRALGMRSELNHAPRPPCPGPPCPMISSVLAQLCASAGGTDASFFGTDDPCDAFRRATLRTSALRPRAGSMVTHVCHER
jgi:hypothetical protein